MSANNTAIKNACAKLTSTRLPAWSELPDLEIYKDQLLSLIDRYLGELPGAEDKLVTGSMVNNYVKLNVMPAPVNKRYTREHIACLIVIALLKTVLPIATLGELIRAEVEATSYEEMYTGFVGNFNSAVSHTLQASDENPLASCSKQASAENPLASCSVDKAIIIAALRSRTEQALALELTHSLRRNQSGKDTGEV